MGASINKYIVMIYGKINDPMMWDIPIRLINKMHIQNIYLDKLNWTDQTIVGQIDCNIIIKLNSEKY